MHENGELKFFQLGLFSLNTGIVYIATKRPPGTEFGVLVTFVLYSDKFHV